MEAGLLSIKDADNVTAIEVKEAAEIEQIAQMLENGQLDYDTVCLDSVTEMSELLLAQEKARSKDPRQAYGEVITVMTRTMRRFRDLKMHVIFVAKEDKLRDESTGMFHYQPMMVGAKLPTQIPYFFDEVLCLRTFTEENEEGKKVTNRWLQTTLGDNYIAKDRSGKLDSFEEPNLHILLINLDLQKEKIMSDFANVKFDFESNNSEVRSTIPEGDYLTEISTCEKTLPQRATNILN
jgi:hypothetical protein